MFASVFSWTTICTDSGKNALLPTWSPWVWVLMMVVTGLSLTSRMRFIRCWPQPGSLVSTSVMPSSPTWTPVFPPLNAERSTVPDPVMTYRLSRTCSMTVASIAACDSSCCRADRRRQPADRDERAEYQRAFHDFPPGCV